MTSTDPAPEIPDDLHGLIVQGIHNRAAQVRRAITNGRKLLRAQQAGLEQALADQADTPTRAQTPKSPEHRNTGDGPTDTDPH